MNLFGGTPHGGAMSGIPCTTPRVDALIDRVMAQHPGLSASAQARYYEEVHQELAPLARDLERENERLRALVAHLAVPVGWKLVPVRPTPEMLDAANQDLRREYATLGLGEGSHLDATKAARNYYAAMLAAAPDLPASAEVSGGL